MKDFTKSRREFLKATGAMAGAFLLSPSGILARTEELTQHIEPAVSPSESAVGNYSLRIRTSPVEIAPKRIISIATYNGQFPGPLLRFKEGQQVTVDVFNDTDTPEQLHWHGQKIPTDVDGAAEEGTPFIPAHGKRRIVFTPKPAGLRFYHTHNRAGGNLAAGQYSGQVGPVYIEPRQEPGRYDREVFLVLKEFEPTFSRGGPDPFPLPPATAYGLRVHDAVRLYFLGSFRGDVRQSIQITCLMLVKAYKNSDP
jgi:FtsP/CotA-like multicopper oxidase with cupredoxin domain